MINRREFLQLGTAAAVAWSANGLEASPAVAPGPGGPADSVTPLYKVLFDERFAEGIAFALRVQECGGDVHPIRGDIRAIWYDDLYHHWNGSPVGVAGLTTARSLFCLDMFARDAGLRVVYYAEHELGADGPVEWSAEVAYAVTHFPRVRCRPIRRAVDPLLPLTSLVSWVIAPVWRKHIAELTFGRA